MVKRNLSVVIPNFNGQEMLALCLPSVFTAVKKACDQHEVIVVDDNSTDNSVQFLKTNFPQVKIVNTGARKGQEFALNLGFAHCQYDLVLQLDSDTKLKEDFCSYIFDYFKDDKIFALAPSVYNWDGDTLVAGQAALSFKRGTLSVFQAPGRSQYSFFASGCAAVFCKSKVLELGGYDPIYQSYHLDEVDLAYRAWKSGYKIVFEPRCVAYHYGSATRSKTFTDMTLARMKARNEWLFTWKNLTDRTLFGKHLLWLLPRLTQKVLKGDIVALSAFFAALKEIRKVKNKRRQIKRLTRFSDARIIKQFT